MTPRYGRIDMEYVAHLATRDPAADGPILMVNFMRYRERADYAGDEAAPQVSGREADDMYAPTEVLADIGAEICFVGDVVATSSDDRWDRMAIVKYPSRRSFIDMQSRHDFQARHVHKDAGMDFTIVVGAVPRPGAEIPARSSAGHVRFDLAPGADALGAGAAVLAVEGVVIGDDRRWPVLGLTRTDAVDVQPLGEGAMAVVARSGIDRLSDVVERWPTTEVAR